MLSRPYCPYQALPTELYDCLYRCFESYPRQSIYTEQHQNLSPQPSLPPIYQSEVIQGLLQYKIPIESTTTTVTMENSQQNTLKYLHIDQPTNITYSAQVINIPVIDREIEEVQYTSQRTTPDLSFINEQPAETITYTHENTPYQPPVSELYDWNQTNQQLPGSSKTTGTVEHTIEANSTQVPILKQSNTIENLSQQQSTFYEENRPSFLHETIANELPLPTPITEEIHQQQENIKTFPLTHDCRSTIQSQRYLSPLTNSAIESNEDDKEDEELFDLQESKVYDQLINYPVRYQCPSRIPTENIPSTSHTIPRINENARLCLVHCPEPIQDVYLPPPLLHRTPPNPQSLCAVCCCVSGKSLIKKIVYKQIEDNQYESQSYIDYGSVIDQLATHVFVRYGNNIIEETGGASVCAGDNEQLHILDFPVYISGEEHINSIEPLVPRY
ncbi:unnamed protein product [Rotaria magnacalcarata]